MPTELVFEMHAEKAALLPGFTGHISRGLHEPNLTKPYSTTLSEEGLNRQTG